VRRFGFALSGLLVVLLCACGARPSSYWRTAAATATTTTVATGPGARTSSAKQFRRVFAGPAPTRAASRSRGPRGAASALSTSRGCTRAASAPLAATRPRSGAPAARRRQARPALLRGCASAPSPLDQQPVFEPPLPRGADAVVDLPRAHCRVCLWASEWLSRRSRRTRCSSYAVGSQPARAVGAASGRLTTNVEPSPNSDSTEIVPPIRLTSSREMYRPRPLPLTPRIMFASAR
jgi:hypothetical protein